MPAFAGNRAGVASCGSHQRGAFDGLRLSGRGAPALPRSGYFRMSLSGAVSACPGRTSSLLPAIIADPRCRRLAS
jgi:hypothetical protein